MWKKRSSYHRWLDGDTCYNCGIRRIRSGGIEVFYKGNRKIGYETPECKKQERLDCNLFVKNYIQLPVQDVYEPVEPVNENLLEVWEVCCEVFGCGRVLSRTEKLFGNKCTNHVQEKKANNR